MLHWASHILLINSDLFCALPSFWFPNLAAIGSITCLETLGLEICCSARCYFLNVVVIYIFQTTQLYSSTSGQAHLKLTLSTNISWLKTDSKLEKIYWFIMYTSKCFLKKIILDFVPTSFFIDLIASFKVSPNDY